MRKWFTCPNPTHSGIIVAAAAIEVLAGSGQ